MEYTHLKLEGNQYRIAKSGELMNDSDYIEVDGVLYYVSQIIGGAFICESNETYNIRYNEVTKSINYRRVAPVRTQIPFTKIREVIGLPKKVNIFTAL